MENSYSVSVPIFKQFHKNIIGKGGANIKKVSTYLFECVDPDVNINHVKCKSSFLFAPFILNLGFDICEWPVKCVIVVFPSLQIREETNTKIDLPAENINSEMIVITGKKANCEAARNRILAIQKELVKPSLESGFQ